MATYKHIRSSTANKRPTTAIADGQIAINTNTASPGLFFKDSAGTGIVKVGPVHVGTTAPNSTPAAGGSSGNYLGEQWLDTSVSPAQLKVWNGSAWVGVVADELPVSKLQDGNARQLLQTDAAGTGVEWTSNVDVPGTLDVTGATTLDSTLTVPLGSAASPTLRFSGDANTGVYSPGPDQLALSTAGTGRLRVTSGGQVLLESSNSFIGVNTEDGSDTSTLLVGGGGAASNSRGAYVWLKGNENTDAGALVLSAGNVGTAPITAVTAGSERLRITSAGLVGIGTGAPVNDLDVNGGVGVTYGDGLKLFRNTGTTNNSILSHEFVAGVGDQLNIAPAGNGTSSGIALQTASGSSLSTKLFINGAGNVGIGTTSPAYMLDVAGTAKIGAATGDARLEIGAGATGNRVAFVDLVGDTTYVDFGLRILRDGTGANTVSQIQHRGTGDFRLITNEASSIAFLTQGSERARIDSSGRLLVGASSAATGFGNLQSHTTGAFAGFYGNFANDVNPAIITLGKSRGNDYTTIVQSGDGVGSLRFNATDGTGNLIRAAQINCEVDGTPGANDMPGRLVFSTTPDGSATPVERMRIDNVGDVMIGVAFATPGSANTSTGIGLNKNGAIFASKSAGVVASINRNTSDGDSVSFRRDGSQVGSISVTTTATAYNTSSDYRLKENVTPVTDGITRLQQLKPSRFNFIADPDKTVDGFLAHEVQAIVPEAITGEKDAVDDDGNPQYQGIDQSKLVPLLTAALQEAVAEINALKVRVAALEGA